MRAVYFDTETTGVNVVDDRIIEIAAYDAKSKKTFSSFVNPGRPIPSEATAIHHITDDMVAQAPCFEKVGQDFLDFLEEDAILIAHNGTSFDFPLLENEGRRYSLDFACFKSIDTLKWARKYRPDLPKHHLQFLRKIYEVEENQAHRALDDVMVLFEVFSKMIDDLDIATVYSLLENSMIDKMPFGKHRGKPLKQLPQEYVDWLNEQKAFEKRENADLKKALVSLGMLS